MCCTFFEVVVGLNFCHIVKITLIFIAVICSEAINTIYLVYPVPGVFGGTIRYLCYLISEVVLENSYLPYSYEAEILL